MAAFKGPPPPPPPSLPPPNRPNRKNDVLELSHFTLCCGLENLFCLVCALPMDERIRLSPCYHVVCQECASGGNVSKHSSCPICSGVISSMEYLHPCDNMHMCKYSDCLQTFLNEASLRYHHNNYCKSHLTSISSMSRTNASDNSCSSVTRGISSGNVSSSSGKTSSTSVGGGTGVCLGSIYNMSSGKYIDTIDPTINTYASYTLINTSGISTTTTATTASAIGVNNGNMNSIRNAKTSVFHPIADTTANTNFINSSIASDARITGNNGIGSSSSSNNKYTSSSGSSNTKNSSSSKNPTSVDERRLSRCHNDIPSMMADDKFSLSSHHPPNLISNSIIAASLPFSSPNFNPPTFNPPGFVPTAFNPLFFSRPPFSTPHFNARYTLPSVNYSETPHFVATSHRSDSSITHDQFTRQDDDDDDDLQDLM